ncbi:Hint domain-containing protein [Paenirhodobacter sp.]|uniref:Hint domain-containing protein n=1 Tax=Paenirhodobacter sp. TaxID=1965326 RepID=UPI003B416F5E
MPPIGYPVSSLHHDRDGGFWRLDPAFKATMAWHLVPDGQEAEVRDAKGGLVARGLQTGDVPLLLEGPEGTVIRLDRIEIDGVPRLYLASEALDPQRTYPDLHPTARAATAGELANLPAFGPGTLINTEDGPVPVERLRPGDRIQTRDHGFQPLLWAGHHAPHPGAESDRPMRIATGTFGADMPSCDTVLSAGTGVLLAGDDLRMWFAEQEMFARLDQLGPTLPRAEAPVTLHTLLLDLPEAIIADGMWVSSVEANETYSALMPEHLREALLPRLASGHTMPARRWMDDWEIETFRRNRAARPDHTTGRAQGAPPHASPTSDGRRIAGHPYAMAQRTRIR